MLLVGGAVLAGAGPVATGLDTGVLRRLSPVVTSGLEQVWWTGSTAQCVESATWKRVVRSTLGT